MRILFTRFPLQSAKGGAENQTLWLMAGLRDKGHDVSFLGSCSVLLQCCGASGIEGKKLEIGTPPVTKWSAISFLWRRKEMLRSLQQAVQEHRPDAVAMLSLTEKILLTPWLASRGIKTVWVEHDRIGRWLTMNPWLAEIKRAASVATVVCVSELSRRMLLELGFDASRTVAIPNGVPDSGMRERAPSGGFTVGCIARLSPEKGVDVLLQAVERIPEATLRIIGTGPEEAYIRSLIDVDTAKHATPRVTLTPSTDDLTSVYDALDVLVLPSSDHDPFGLVAAEAMMRGIPVIVTDACGIADYLHAGIDALVAKAGDQESLSACIRRLLDPAFSAALGEKGAAVAREQFSVEHMVERYHHVFTGN